MVDGNQNVEERKIGIYTGQVWHSDLMLKADFDVSRLSELNTPNLTLGEPFIVISVGDARGIGVVKTPELNGTALVIFCLMISRFSVNTPVWRCVSRVWSGRTRSGLVFRRRVVSRDLSVRNAWGMRK